VYICSTPINWKLFDFEGGVKESNSQQLDLANANHLGVNSRLLVRRLKKQ